MDRSPLTTRAVLLQALFKESGYGSEIIERVKALTGSAVVLHSGSVYPAFLALEKSGLIRKRVMKLSQEIGRACFYELTRKGRHAAMRDRETIRLVCELLMRRSTRGRKASKRKVVEVENAAG